MSLNNSLSNGVNEDRDNNWESISPSRCPAGKQDGPSRDQYTVVKKWTKEETKTAISCYLKATKESKGGYKKQMHNLLNEIEIFEIEKQHVERKVLSVFKNNRLTEI